MDQIKTGRLIRSLRTRRGVTQAELAQLIGVSDKAVSKWERGCGAPDLSLLSQALGVDIEALFRGEMEENKVSCGNMKKLKFYVCPDCGNLVFSTEEADISCFGRKLTAALPQKAAGDEMLSGHASGGEWCISSAHEMRREHYISFVAFLTGDTLIVKKFYPEWGARDSSPLLLPQNSALVLHKARPFQPADITSKTIKRTGCGSNAAPGQFIYNALICLHNVYPAQPAAHHVIDVVPCHAADEAARAHGARVQLLDKGLALDR